MGCGICARAGDVVCDDCDKLAWESKVKLLQLRRIADALENIEKKMKDENKW